MVIDIDFFKSINDTYGHDTGDDVLREFAVRIRNHPRHRSRLPVRRRGVRDRDAGNRHGGGDDRRRAAATAHRVQAFNIAQGAKAIDVTISSAIATLESADDTPSTILKRADQALYRAKRDGRNRVVVDAA